MTQVIFIEKLVNGCFNTVNGKHCCNELIHATVAPLISGFNTVNGKHCCNESSILYTFVIVLGFNTVNGKHCCNSIPQKASIHGA